MEGSKVRIDPETGERVDPLGKLIAELTEKIQRDAEYEPLTREPIVLKTIADDPPPALRYLEETREEFHARMRAKLNSIRR